MGKIRVLVVDDSALIRRLITDLLNEDSEIEVVGIAGNGQQALLKTEQLNPDLITLDVEMPVMDGLSCLRELRKIHAKLPIIMFSTLSERGSSATLEALSLGASDYVTKPSSASGVAEASNRVRDELIPKIKALCHRRILSSLAGKSSEKSVSAPSQTPPRRSDRAITAALSKVDVVAIGVSTGGPNALAELIPALGKSLPVPVLIVQHMPPLFTRLLAERLANVSGAKCREGAEGLPVLPGEIYIAPGGTHLVVKRGRDGVTMHLNEEPPENSCRPAVDVMLRSVAQAYGAKVLTVILTGMGQDGMKGCESIRAAGGHVFAQDEATSVVWGMPGAVAAAGLADKILPLQELAPAILARV